MTDCLSNPVFLYFCCYILCKRIQSFCMISHGNRMLRILKHGKIIHTVSKYICPIQFHPEFFQDYIAGSPFTVAFLHNFIGIASAVNCFHIFLDKRKKFLKIAFLICIMNTLS